MRRARFQISRQTDLALDGKNLEVKIPVHLLSELVVVSKVVRCDLLFSDYARHF